MKSERMRVQLAMPCERCVGILQCFASGLDCQAVSPVRGGPETDEALLEYRRVVGDGCMKSERTWVQLACERCLLMDVRVHTH